MHTLSISCNDTNNKNMKTYINMDFVVEPGEFKVMIGNSSVDNNLTIIQLMIED
jgi:hypothetical protein